jgi:hypothetical protein
MPQEQRFGSIELFIAYRNFGSPHHATVPVTGWPAG